MGTITIPKVEYEFLKKRADAYERVLSLTHDELFSPPATRDRKVVVDELRKTGRYSERFLASIEKGLRRSSYFTK